MKTNQELLAEANKIAFKITKSGSVSFHKHNRYERGLFFIRKAIELHGINTYQYGLVNYADNATKVEIFCPDHGSFFQTPSNHVGKMNKCPKCSVTHQPTTEEWVENAKKIHGDLYDYSNVVYKKAHEKVTIICRTHGPFEQTPSNHLSGQGCIRCGNNYQYDTNEWIEKAKKIHSDRYDYSNSEYINANTKIEIICPQHGPFLQTPSNHLSGKGCPKCAGQSHNILYLLRCNDTGWYKIGITTDNIQKRITSIGGNIEEVFHVVCSNPREHETYLHKLYDKDREYNLLVKSGNTEFFSLTKEQVAKIRQYMASIAINQKSI